MDSAELFEDEPNLADLDFEASVARGLTLRPRRFASKWLYDDRGAALFEDIVASEAYYVGRAELEILETYASEIGEIFGTGGTLVELGSGASHKVRRLLDAMPGLARYVPVEISQAQLIWAAAAIRADYPALEVLPVAADYTREFDLPAGVTDGPVLGSFLGTTLCNFLPANSEAFLRRMHALLGTSSWFLVGVDLDKDPDRLVAAYNDPGGALWDFNLNILRRMNRELGTSLEAADFRHEAVWNPEYRRIEAGLYPRRDLSVTVAGQMFDLPAGEPIILEYSHKYSIEAFAALAARAGWRSVTAWTDKDQMASIHLLTNRSSV